MDEGRRRNVTSEERQGREGGASEKNGVGVDVSACAARRARATAGSSASADLA